MMANLDEILGQIAQFKEDTDRMMGKASAITEKAQRTNAGVLELAGAALAGVALEASNKLQAAQVAADEAARALGGAADDLDLWFRVIQSAGGA